MWLFKPYFIIFNYAKDDVKNYSHGLCNEYLKNEFPLFKKIYTWIKCVTEIVISLDVVEKSNVDGNTFVKRNVVFIGIRNHGLWKRLNSCVINLKWYCWLFGYFKMLLSKVNVVP